MANTFVRIASVTVGSGGASSISFSSIPATYTDLIVKVSARTTNAGAGFQSLDLQFNSSSADRSGRYLTGDGSSPGSGTLSTTSFLIYALQDAGTTSNTFTNAELYIPNYAGSTNKSSSVDAVTENNGTSAGAAFTANLWSNTAAITSITLTPQSGNLVQYSTATLYGIKSS